MSIKDGILDLTIKKHWFELIKAGSKSSEYRNYDGWKNKLDNDLWKNYQTVRFRLGQTTKSTDKNKTLIANILDVKVVNGKDTDLKCRNKVFKISFELIK